MSFGKRLRERRIELKMSQSELARALGITAAAVSNYESGQNAVREDILLKLFRVLDTDPNYLYQDSITVREFTCSVEEKRLIGKYRILNGIGRQTLHSVADALGVYQADLESTVPTKEMRQIPLYFSLAAVGDATPVFGEDFEYMDVTDTVPPGADFAVRMQGNSMEPYIMDGSVVYVNRDPLENGDVGIFCVDGEILCKQYVRDTLGMVYLFSLNRACADADVVFPRSGGRTMVCIGRVLLPSRPPIVGKLKSRD